MDTKQLNFPIGSVVSISGTAQPSFPGTWQYERNTSGDSYTLGTTTSFPTVPTEYSDIPDEKDKLHSITSGVFQMPILEMANAAGDRKDLALCFKYANIIEDVTILFNITDVNASSEQFAYSGIMTFNESYYGNAWPHVVNILQIANPSKLKLSQVVGDSNAIFSISYQNISTIPYFVIFMNKNSHRYRYSFTFIRCKYDSSTYFLPSTLPEQNKTAWNLIQQNYGENIWRRIL